MRVEELEARLSEEELAVRMSIAEALEELSELARRTLDQPSDGPPTTRSTDEALLDIHSSDRAQGRSV